MKGIEVLLGVEREAVLSNMVENMRAYSKSRRKGEGGAEKNATLISSS
jgi:hypothetical protein